MRGLFSLVILLASFTVWSQGTEQEIDRELDKIYEEASLKGIEEPKKQVITAEVSGESLKPSEKLVSSEPLSISKSEPVVSKQNNIEIKNVQTQVQQQPSIRIQARPVGESRAASLRKARQEAEAQTELKIVERLEKSRIEDESRRSKALFGGGFDSLQREESTEQVNNEPSLNIKEEIRAAISDLKSNGKSILDRTFFGGSIGFGDYPDAINIESNFSAGFSMGTVFEDRMIAELSFLYGNYEIEEVFSGSNNGFPLIKSMDQYSVDGLFRYQLLTGRLRPSVGAVTSYAYRSYSDSQYYLAVSEGASSHAMDMGVAGSVDLTVNSHFTVSGEYRYLWNIWSKTNRNNDPYQNSSFSNNSHSYGGRPLEEFSRYVFLLSGKFSF